MDINATTTAMRRAAKAYHHAKRALDEATTDRAKARHARRLRNAMRASKEAARTYEALAMETA
jgi:hypothetical protein